MDIVLLVLRLLLAGVFSLAAIAKLLDQTGSQKAMTDFGVPASMSKPASLLLSVVELTIAVSLLFVSSAWFGAIGAGLLLAVFIAAMMYQVLKGNAPDCHCFGQVHSEPVGTSSIVRNILLFAGSSFLISRGQFGQGFSLVQSDQDVLTILIGICVVGLLLVATVYLATIASKQEDLVRKIGVLEAIARDGGLVEREDAGNPNEGLPIGALVPYFALPGLDGAVVSLADIRADGLPVLFTYVSPTCNPCEALLPEFDEWKSALEGKVKLVFLSTGREQDNRAKFTGNIAGDVLLQKDREVTDSLMIKWTPTSLLMDAHGRVASHMAAGDTAIRELVQKLQDEDLSEEYKYFAFATTPAKIRIGESVPEIELTDIDGNTVTAANFHGKETLVTFWSTGCPHCLNMMDELREWDISRGENEPNLVLFSDGDEEAHKEFGLRAPVIIDKGHKNAAEFGMYGTPSAVLVDADGKIITETAIGAPNIWSLIGRERS